METKDIREIELTYNCWITIEIDDLDNAELFKSGKVGRFWVKHCTLHMELEDGTVVEESVYRELDWDDTKWPKKVMVDVGDGKRARWKAYKMARVIQHE